MWPCADRAPPGLRPLQGTKYLDNYSRIQDRIFRGDCNITAELWRRWKAEIQLPPDQNP